MTNPDPTASPSPTPPENPCPSDSPRHILSMATGQCKFCGASSESVPKISAGVSEEERVSVLRINRDFLAAEQLRLLRMIEVRDTVIDQMRVERVLLAKLASDKPQFDNPLVAWKAQELRDKILSEEAPDVR